MSPVLTNVDWFQPGTRTGGPIHGWLGCCLTHDAQRETEADRAGDRTRHTACDECGAACPPEVGRRQPEDPQTFLCPWCEDIAAEALRQAAADEDDDWRRER